MKKLLLIIICLLFSTNAWAIIEDFTTFISSDPNNDLTITSSSILTDSNVDTRDVSSYVYKDYTSIDDFEVEIETTGTDVIVNNYSGPIVIVGLTDTSAQTFNNWSEGFIVDWYMDSQNRVFLELKLASQGYNCDNATVCDRYQPYDLDTDIAETKWLTISRTGTTVIVKSYSDSSRTTLEDTLTLTVSTNAYQYMYVYSTMYISVSGRTFGDVENKDLDLISGFGLQPTPTQTELRNVTLRNVTIR